MIVMKAIVFHIPGFWRHPIAPILNTFHDIPKCKAAAIKLARVDSIVSLYVVES
jgi:hypothetical protein